MSFVDEPDVVNPAELPNVAIDWSHFCHIHGAGLSYDIHVGPDGAIATNVNVTISLGGFDSNQLVGHTINQAVKNRPDGYYFMDAVVTHTELIMYFAFHIPGSGIDDSVV